MQVSDLTEIIETSLKRFFESQKEKSHDRREEDKLLTTNDVIQLFNVSRVTIHNWKKSGLLPFFKMGNRVYFNEYEVRRVIEEKQSGGF
jgi:predicted site-specific integrase-resolvase